jgi:hypothetical protein
MTTIDHVAVLAPRALGLAMAGFFALFAFDPFVFQLPLSHAVAFTLLQLIPAMIVFLLVVLGWHRPFAGGLGFLAAAALYALVTVQSRLDWIAAISGPLIVVGLAFLWTWQRQQRLGEAT